MLREIMTADIRKGLAVYQDYVRPGGPLNLTDTNVNAENFVAGVLNAIHGWNLVSTNQATANYPCIDLIDEQLGLGVQVTAEEDSDKLTKTVDASRRITRLAIRDTLLRNHLVDGARLDV